MKTILRFLLQSVATFFLFVLLVLSIHADTGKYSAQRVEVGNTPNSRKVSCLGSASTLLFAARDDRPDETCVNISSFSVHIGSNAAGTTLRSIGFVIFSSATVSFGAQSGSAYCLSDNAAAAELRCWDGLTQ